MKALLLALTVASSSMAFASDYQVLAKNIVKNLYGRPGDIVSVETYSNPNIIGVTLSNGAKVGSVSYTVEIKERKFVAAPKPGDVVTDITVRYQDSN